MNPLDWEDALRRLPRSLDPNPQSCVNNNTGNASTDSNTYCHNSSYTVDEAHNSMGVNVERKKLSLPSHNFSSKESEVEDPDGEALEMDEEDPELARKRKELRELEEKIMRKKVSIALKTVEPIVKNTMSPGFSCSEQSATCKSAKLRDRVNVILQQRQSLSCLTKSAQAAINSSCMRESGVLHAEDHPLKIRVKALMSQRCSGPCVLPTNITKVPDVTPLPSSQSLTSAVQEKSSVNKGFERFLSVLNKGVDIELLSKIVNDDSEDLHLGEELKNIHSPGVESKSHLSFRNESQQSNRGAPLPGCSRTNSGELNTDPQPHNESHSLPYEEKKDGGYCFVGSNSRSKSPPAVKENKKEEKIKPKADEQHEQLQNVLKTLGLSLEVEEMNKLADRTQERLYGKKREGRQKVDSREEQESQSHRQYSKSSSSSSSSSSRSTSRSFSRSLSRHSRSHSRERGRASDCSRSRDRHRDVVTCQDGSQASKEAQRHMDEDRKHFKETFQHPQTQMYPSYPPPGFSALPENSYAHYSQHSVYQNGSYSGNTNSYWTYSQGSIPSPLHPSGYPYPQNSYHHFPGPVTAPNMVYPHSRPVEDINLSSHLTRGNKKKGKNKTHYNPFEDIHLLLNPDLSKSEGQMGSSSGLHNLQVISTKQSNNQSCLKQLTKGRKRKGKYETWSRRHRLWLAKKREKKRLQKLAEKQTEDSAARVETPQGKKEDSEAEQSEDEKQQPTEEEIKANLRKKLEAFNQMVKQKVTQPAIS